MKLPSFAKHLAIAAAAFSMTLGAQAADYPTRQVELVVPYAAGGGTDLVARAYGEAMKKHFPQSIGVTNKTGGGGALGLTDIVRARPDGYKIGLVTVEATTLPALGMVQFTAADFKPIARLNAEPSAITVKADAPWNTVEEFLDYAKKNPGKVRIGNSGTGAIWHLAAAALEDKTGAKFNHIPFDGAAPAMTSLLGGHIEAVTVSPAEVSPHVAAGALKILAVMSDKRVKAFDKVPTLKERNIDLSIATWRGVAVPKNTPKNVVDALTVATQKAAAEPTFIATLEKLNLTPAYQSSADFEKTMQHDAAYFKTLIEKLGLKK